MMEKSFSSNNNEELPDTNTVKAVAAAADFAGIAESYKRIVENIGKAMLRAGRTDNVRLMAVTKTVPYEKVNFAASLGVDLLGENRVQEFLGKYDFYDKNCEIHFIGGRLRKKDKNKNNKGRMIKFPFSAKYAAEIDKRALAVGKIIDILIEVNIGREESKGGVLCEELDELVSFCFSLSGARLRGFMAIPPPALNGGNEKYFELMERIYRDYRLKYGGIDTLSMGMSQDYERAVLYGSNIVRVGSALFGKRKYKEA